MSSATKTTKSYTYRSGVGGNADVSIEYSADLSALSRLEVSKVRRNFRRGWWKKVNETGGNCEHNCGEKMCVVCKKSY